MSDDIQKEGENVVRPDFGEKEGPKPAFGVHVVMMQDGGFGIQATGEPNLGEMHMILSRALKSIEARMLAETVVQLTGKTGESSRIITPGR